MVASVLRTVKRMLEIAAKTNACAPRGPEMRHISWCMTIFFNILLREVKEAPICKPLPTNTPPLTRASPYGHSNVGSKKTRQNLGR